MTADPRTTTAAPPRPRRLRVVRAGERAVDPARTPPRDEPSPLPFEQRVAVALVVEFLAGVVSLALAAPLGWAALTVLPVTLVVLVWWLTR